MAKGISITLYNGSTPQANETGITALWWDRTDIYDFSWPLGKARGLTTDANGVLKLDLTRVTGQAIGAYGYLILRKEDTQDHRNSLVFQGRVQISDVTGGTLVRPNFGWEYPAGWPDIREQPPTGTDIVKVLFFIYEPFGLASLYFTVTSGGQYQVNWGDGSSPTTHNSGTRADYRYDYSNSNLTDTGYGYKVAVATVTPVGANNLATANFCQRHANVYSSSTSWAPPILAVMMNCPQMTSVVFGGANNTVKTLKAVYIYQNNISSNINSMFMNCYSLEHVDCWIANTITSATYTFYNCGQLKVLPVICDFTQLTTINNIAQASTALREIPSFGGTGNLSASAAFGNCEALEAVNITRPVTLPSGLVQNCYSLRAVYVNLQGATTLSNVCNGCNSLRRAVFDNCGSLASTSTPFSAYNALEGLLLNGIKCTVSVAQGAMSAAALNALFTSLGMANSGATITVTGNYGINEQGFDPSIASEGKGWQVITT